MVVTCVKTIFFFEKEFGLDLLFFKDDRTCRSEFNSCDLGNMIKKGRALLTSCTQ